MEALQITLIVIGIIIIIISCFMIDKSQNNSSTSISTDFLVENGLTEEQKKLVKAKIDELISEASDEVIVRADDTLSKISNEKIIAVHEFSDQILEKINRNHEEVIFLYNMLNDKERELKSAVQEMDSTKKKAKEILETTVINDTLNKPKKNTTVDQTSVITQADRIGKQIKTSHESVDSNNTSEHSNDTNFNENILALYSQGKSIMDISKELDLGQGEVKLVIDLYKSKK